MSEQLVSSIASPRLTCLLPVFWSAFISPSIATRGPPQPRNKPSLPKVSPAPCSFYRSWAHEQQGVAMIRKLVVKLQLDQSRCDHSTLEGFFHLLHKRMSKWCVVRSTSGCELIQECDLLHGAAAVSEDVDYLDYRGTRVSGVILALDRSKKAMQAEKGRIEGVMGGSGDESDTGSVASSPARATRSRAGSCSSNGSATATPSTPRPTRVGQPPFTAAPARRGGAPAGGGASTTGTRRPRVPVQSQVPAHATPAVLIPPGQGVAPLIPPSLLPAGFNLTNTPPLVMPATTDDAAFKQFIMSSMVALHTEIAGVKQMVNNIWLGWNPLIVQTANRATGTHQEVNGTKDTLVELNKTVTQLESSVQLVSDQVGKTAEFKYEPYTTKDEVDGVDKNQLATVLATDLQKLIYKETDPTDDADLSLAFNKRTNRAKAKWLLEAVVHRRMVSTGENRQLVERQIIERLNNYAGIRRRSKEKEARDRAAAARVATTVRGGPVAINETRPEDDNGRGERANGNSNPTPHNDDEEMLSDTGDFVFP